MPVRTPSAAILAMSGRSESHFAAHCLRTPDGMVASAVSWIVVPGASVVELPTIRRSENTGNAVSCGVGLLGDPGPHAASMAVRMMAAHLAPIVLTQSKIFRITDVATV